jgi:hypothetical protein
MILLLVGIARGSYAQAAKQDCFSIERAPGHLRSRAEALLLETADSSALYTLITGLKPLSSNFLSSLGPARPPRPEASLPGALVFPTEDLTSDTATLREIDELHQLMEFLTCGSEFRATVLMDIGDVGRRPNQSSAEPFLFNLPALRRLVAAHAALYAGFGVTPHTPPEALVLNLERFNGKRPEEREARLVWDRANAAKLGAYDRAKGLLYGYPLTAIEAYVAARQKEFETGVPTRRGGPNEPVPSYIRIPGHNSTGEGHPNSPNELYYTMAVRGQPNEEDRALRRNAEAILTEYRRRRALYIGPDKPGIAALLRDWFCTPAGCSAANATVPNVER